MKALITKIAVLAIFGVSSSAFISKPGGEGFEIYLNNKVVVQNWGAEIKKVKNLQLSQASANDKLTVKYYHCGKAGNQRTVSIRNAKNQVLRSFRYPDTKSATAMEVPVTEILKLHDQTVNLYYSSSELTAAKLLLTINTGGTLAANK